MLFRQIDVDGNKFITNVELFKALNRSKIKITQEQVDKIIQWCDQDTNNKLSLKEFRHFMYIMQNMQQDNNHLLQLLIFDGDMNNFLYPETMGRIVERLKINVSPE